MADEDEGVIAQGGGFDFGMEERASDADVGFSVEDHFQNFHGISGTKGDEDFGMSVLIVLQNVREEICADRKSGGDAQRAEFGRLVFVDDLAGEGDLPQQLLGMGTQRFTSGRKRQAIAVACEKRDAERFFESANSSAYSGLGYTQCLSGAVETTVGEDGEEGFELVDFHRISSKMRLELPKVEEQFPLCAILS